MLALVGLVLIAFAFPAAAQGPWSLPAPGSCNPGGGLATEGGEDATRFPFEEGDVVGPDRAAALRSYLPDFVWAQRERFFQEGARLEVGPCFRDYAAPAFFQEAGASPARLGPDGELEGYGAGVPFPPASIARDDPQAGAKWLWNVENRYQGAGFHGRFRLTDVTGSDAEPFVGRIFKIALAHRADRPGPKYAVEDAGDRMWVAGGEFEKPFDAKDYAWRQIRPADPERPDDLFAYLPQWRRVRRLPTSHVEGLFVPTPAISAVQGNQIAGGAGLPNVGAQAGSGGTGGGSAASPGAGAAGNPSELGLRTEPLRGAFAPFGLRPALYDAEVVGVRDVMAPINVAKPMWPAAPDRDFGPSGLSLASDRWELRRAVVIDATPREAEGDRARTRIYADLQTLQPLYVATYDSRGELGEVAIYASRWSEDRSDYPRWPGDDARAIRVLDPVASVVTSPTGRTGWRWESWDMVSTPPDEADVRRWLSVSDLTRGQ